MPTIAHDAIRWYTTNARDLLWRRPETTPWGVLVSEVMLQQTPVTRVEPVWSQWMRRWPKPANLARDTAGQAIRVWGGLGYPRRALRLHHAARTIVEQFGGVVPTRVDDLRGLAGIGEYTARAVAVFGYGQRHPVVGRHVFIGTGAVLLGPIRVGDRAKIGANAFVVNRDVPPDSTVVGTPARIVKLDGRRVDAELPRMATHPGAVPVEL